MSDEVDLARHQRPKGTAFDMCEGLWFHELAPGHAKSRHLVTDEFRTAFD
jgi:hypothetical protein